MYELFVHDVTDPVPFAGLLHQSIQYHRAVNTADGLRDHGNPYLTAVRRVPVVETLRGGEHAFPHFRRNIRFSVECARHLRTRTARFPCKILHRDFSRHCSSPRFPEIPCHIRRGLSSHCSFYFSIFPGTVLAENRELLYNKSARNIYGKP